MAVRGGPGRLRRAVENVDEAEVVVAISSLLGRIPGYRWERMVVCPFVNYGEPVRRRRSFWVGRRLD